MHKLDAEKKSSAGHSRSEDAVVEVAVLLESRLMKALESAARARDMTAGALVRNLLRDFLCYSDSGALRRGAESQSKKTSLC